jgi:hypothetical protein
MDAQIYAITCLPNITTSKHKKEERMAVDNIGATVHVMRDADINLGPYVKGGEMKIDPSIGKSFPLTINRAHTWNKFHDFLDTHASKHKNLTAREITAAVETQAAAMEQECFAEWASFPDSCNVGNSAGFRSHAFRLGTIDHPVIVSKDNALAYFGQFLSLFKEVDLTNRNGKLSIVIPPVAEYIFRQAPPVVDASQSGVESSLQTQLITSNYKGIGDIYSSTLLPDVTSGVFPVLALRADGLSFFSKNLLVRANRELEKTFGSLTSGVFVYDWNVIREEAIAIGYVQLNMPNLEVAA